MHSKKRIGIIGAGYISEFHAHAIRALRCGQLAAICDTNEGRARAFASAWKCPTIYSDLETMLAEANLDVVHVLTPPDSHAFVAKAALEADVNVILEKPMADTSPKCAELNTLARSKKLHLGVGHNFLFSRAYESLRRDVKEGHLGPIQHVSINWFRELGQARSGPFSAWMLRDPRSIVLEIGSHPLSVFCDLVGAPEIDEVKASQCVTLPTGVPFYRRWQIDAHQGNTQLTCGLSFRPGFDVFQVQVHGLFGLAQVDLTNDAYTIDRHTGRSMDFDRYARAQKMGRDLRKQATRTLMSYVGSKCKIRRAATPYQRSITAAIETFYRTIQTGEGDERLSGDVGARVVDLAEKIGHASEVLSVTPPTRQVQGAETATAEILVLGGTGFIGRCLVRLLLKRGLHVRLLVRDVASAAFAESSENLNVVQGDLRDVPTVQRALAGIKTVFHLAKSENKTFAGYLRNDVEPTVALARAAIEAGVRRFIYAGTIDSLYLGPGAGVIDDETKPDPKIKHRNNYARSKAEAERQLRELSRTGGLPLVTVRPAIVIGSGGLPMHWGIGKWDGAGLCEVWGKGTHPIPFVLVDDVADALVKAMEVEGIEGRCFNLAAKSSISAKQYLDAVERSIGGKIDVRSVSTTKLWLIDLVKWVAKVATRHPDASRLPSLRDWRCREQHATFECHAARTGLGWNPVDDTNELVRRGIEIPAREYLA